jgi:hypothetical protein
MEINKEEIIFYRVQRENHLFTIHIKQHNYQIKKKVMDSFQHTTYSLIKLVKAMDVCFLVSWINLFSKQCSGNDSHFRWWIKE